MFTKANSRPVFLLLMLKRNFFALVYKGVFVRTFAVYCRQPWLSLFSYCKFLYRITNILSSGWLAIVPVNDNDSSPLLVMKKLLRGCGHRYMSVRFYQRADHILVIACLMLHSVTGILNWLIYMLS